MRILQHRAGLGHVLDASSGEATMPCTHFSMRVLGIGTMLAMATAMLARFKARWLASYACFMLRQGSISIGQHMK